MLDRSVFVTMDRNHHQVEIMSPITPESTIDPIHIFTDKIYGPQDIEQACIGLFAVLDPRPSHGFFNALGRLNHYLLSHHGPWLMVAPEEPGAPERFPRIREPVLSDQAFEAFLSAYNAMYPEVDPRHRQAFVDLISGVDEIASFAAMPSEEEMAASTRPDFAANEELNSRRVAQRSRRR